MRTFTTPSRPVVHETSVGVRTSSEPRSGNRERKRFKVRGDQALREFVRAPADVQADFWDRVGAAADSEHALDRHLAWLYSDEPDDQEPEPPGRLRPFPVWNRKWSRRARGIPPVRRGVRADDLRTIPAAEYVATLTGEEGLRIDCPLPDHDDSSRDFSYRGEQWRCFGCNRHGDIFELAGLLWGLDGNGRDFHEICGRLGSLFGVQEKAA